MSSNLEGSGTLNVSDNELPPQGSVGLLDDINKLDMSDKLQFSEIHTPKGSKHSSTTSSSPFITDPNISCSNPQLVKESEPLSITDKINVDNITLHSNSMDDSIANLRESLANLRVNDSRNTGTVKETPEPVDSPKYQNNSFHNSTIDTTRYNDMHAQLDNDFDFDDRDAFACKPQRATNPSTPWRKLRSVSTYTSSNRPDDIPKLQFSKPNFINRTSLTSKNSLQSQDASASAKIDELNKQVTGYRIQIKFFKQFLQNLIDRTRLQEGSKQPVLDINELTHFQSNLDGLSPYSNPKSNEQIKLEMDYNNLAKNYDEVFRLNEDLYENLEDFQNQLHDKEMQLQRLNQYINDCSKIINEILQLLINDPNTDDVSRQALSRCVDSHNSSKPLDMKMHVIKLELNKKLESKGVLYPSPPSSNSDKEREKEQEEVSSYIDIIQSLIASLDSLQKEFLKHKTETSQIENDLKREAEESKAIKKNYKLISLKFNHLCKSFEESASIGSSEEIKRLRRENERLSTINQSVDAKFDEYQNIIDKLQNEVNDFKDFARRNSIERDSRNESINESLTRLLDQSKSISENELHEELLQSHKEFKQLNEEFNELTEKYRKLKEDSSNTISSLTNQSHNKQQEIYVLRADQKVTEKLKQDLDIAVEKQRILKAEKIRLSYNVESLSNDKVSLQSTIRSLTDKITALTVAETHDNSETVLKKLNIIEYQFEDLLSFDVYEFQKLLKSFNKIADDASLKEPTRKIESLCKKVAKQEDQTKILDINDFNLIKEYHKSIFEYFARAVDIIVNDHVKLLLKENEATSQTGEYVARLHKRIDDLNAINDALSKQLDSFNINEQPRDLANTTVTSPRSKLRIEELSNRWKAEREARVYENKESQRRLKELELENARLRAELNK